MLTVTAAGETVTVPVPMLTAGRTLVFSDDFTGGLGKWNVRNNDTSNNTDCIYFPANVTTQADGVHLTAKRQAGLSKPYSSGYIDTIGRMSQSTGRWEIVAKLPSSRGLWPALWLRCDNNAAGPVLGEIDILEAVCPLNDAVQTVHQSTNGDMDKSGFEYKPAGLDLTQFHAYALERDGDGTLRWYVDGILTRTARPSDLSTKLHQPMTWLAGPTFSTPLNLRINLQVGGSMPISFAMDVDSTTVLPADFVIRSVRIYH